MLFPPVLLACVMAVPVVLPVHTAESASQKVSAVQLSELSPEHRARMRGDMRELWSTMTPGEKDALAREYQESLMGSDRGPRPERARFERSRQMSPEDHRSLRQDLRDMSGGNTP